MAIEFRCDHCQRMLRVPDQSAGARARCPQCGNVQQAPDAPTSPAEASVYDAHPAGSPADARPAANPFADSPTPNPYSDNPYASPYAEGYQGPFYTAEHARSKVMAPAIAMIILGSIGLLGMAAFAIMILIEIGNAGDVEAVIVLSMIGVGVLTQALIVIGAVRAMSLKNYGLALTSAILGLLTGMSCLLTLPFAIWLLVVLCDSNVKPHFT